MASYKAAILLGQRILKEEAQEYYAAALARPITLILFIPCFHFFRNLGDVVFVVVGMLLGPLFGAFFQRIPKTTYDITLDSQRNCMRE